MMLHTLTAADRNSQIAVTLNLGRCCKMAAISILADENRRSCRHESSHTKNRLLAWFIGIAMVVLGELYIVYEMFVVGCPAPLMLEIAVLIIIPLV